MAAFCTARVLAADLDGETPYIASELIDGPSLRQVAALGVAATVAATDRSTPAGDLPVAAPSAVGDETAGGAEGVSRRQDVGQVVPFAGVFPPIR
ncbi:Zn-dependent alcohol dehydrogenase [Streptosporangium album]|uniref:Zn-dependent alcohol dehydrogenase n=1 Tax=Streptosporangium album TaxID=47479 RepID=A0A7W7W7R5_9ACTN|nr:hypothetical protein [Streptosporangium album]MBB4936195.1 Zn-dependent alcohol dehydrogenase [Streptosporangium album]